MLRGTGQSFVFTGFGEGNTSGTATAVVVGMSPNSVIVDLPQQFVSSSVGTVAFVGVNVMFNTQNNGNVPSQTTVAVVDGAGPTVIDVRTTTPQTTSRSSFW
ncbi:MAG: hypothetical protein VXX80_10890 [Bacteroidota bacterium]|nr:hypothetical protein [Bacteroidota bacterium]